MNAGPRAALYTPEILALAVELASYPLDEGAQITGDARSRSCGSTLTIGLTLDDEGRIAACGLRATTCAIGQAAAAIFASDAIGRSAAQLRDAHAAIADWLSDPDAPEPDWRGMAQLSGARAYPGRHEAVLLAWKAGANALSNTPSSR